MIVVVIGMLCHQTVQNGQEHKHTLALHILIDSVLEPEGELSRLSLPIFLLAGVQDLVLMIQLVGSCFAS